MATGRYVDNRRRADISCHKKDMEPTLLLPMGFGAILVNLPLSGAVTQIYDGIKEIGVIDVLFESRNSQ